MGVLSVFSLSLLIALLVWKLLPLVHGYCRRLWYVRNLPRAPNEHWFWGSIFQVVPNETTMLYYNKWNNKTQNKFWVVWMGPLLYTVSVAHPEPIRHILKEPKSWSYKLLDPWLGDGLLVSNGPKWYRNRHLLTPAFHYEILKSYVQVYNSCVGVMLEQWAQAIGRDGVVLEVYEYVSLLTLDVVLQCAFSHKSNCQREGKSLPYIKAVYDLSDLTLKQIMKPLYQIWWVFPLTREGRDYYRKCRLVHDHSEKIIKERKRVLGLDGEKGDGTNTNYGLASSQRKYLDFLDILLTARDSDGKGLSDVEIRDEVDTFMFEGHDTTASGISWTLYCLALHQEHQSKCRGEVKRVLGTKDWLEYDDLKELQYTQWCIKEAMRLYPPVPSIFRDTTKDLRLGDSIIPKGSWLSISIYMIHHNEALWENPEKFDPLRFHPERSKDRDPYAYLTFSAGQRNCIGQNFAMNMLKLAISSILHRFSLSTTEDCKTEMSPKIVLRAVDGIKLKLLPLS